MNIQQNTYSGYTADTSKHLLLDAGAFYKNFIVGVDTPDTAVSKLVGATRGGGEFKALPTFEPIKVDGMRDGARGMDRLTKWDVSLTANMLESKPDTFKMALGAAVVDTESNEKYTVIRGRNLVLDSDYYDNITWIGTLSGSNDPVIIQVLNAFSTAGLTITPVDEDQAVFKVELHGRTSRSCNGRIDPFAPFRIYYPKKLFLPAPCADPVYDDDTKVNGCGAVTATVTVKKESDNGSIGTGVVDNLGKFSIIIPAQTAGTALLISQTAADETSEPFRLSVLSASQRPPEEQQAAAAPVSAVNSAKPISTTATVDKTETAK